MKKIRKIKALALLFGNKVIFGDGARYTHIGFCEKSTFEVRGKTTYLTGLTITNKV